MKSTLVRFGIRGFNVKLRKAPERLDELRGPEGVPLPPNTLAELRRDMARLRLVRGQIAEIEKARQWRVREGPPGGKHTLGGGLSPGIRIGTADARPPLR